MNLVELSVVTYLISFLKKYFWYIKLIIHLFFLFIHSQFIDNDSIWNILKWYKNFFYIKKILIILFCFFAISILWMLNLLRNFQCKIIYERDCFVKLRRFFDKYNPLFLTKKEGSFIEFLVKLSFFLRSNIRLNGG